MNVVSILFWNGCNILTFIIGAFTQKANQPVFTYRIPWVHLTTNYCVDKLYLFTFDKSVYVKHFHPFSLLFKQHTFLSIWFGLLSQMNFQIKSFTSFLYFSGTTSFHCVTCQITMSDLMLHVHICLLITLLTPWCIAYHYIRCND